MVYELSDLTKLELYIKIVNYIFIVYFFSYIINFTCISIPRLYFLVHAHLAAPPSPPSHVAGASAAVGVAARRGLARLLLAAAVFWLAGGPRSWPEPGR